MFWQSSGQTSRFSRPFSAVALLCLCGLLTLLPGVALAFDNAETRATLRGLGGVEVGVGEVIPEVARSGVTIKSIRQKVTQQLQRAGIAIVNREELLQRSDAAFFAVTLGAIRHPAGKLYAYSIDVSVYQTATLTRDPALILSLPTWSIASFGIVRSSNLRGLLASIGKRVEQFIQAHSAVNPRPTASDPALLDATSKPRSTVKAPRQPLRPAHKGKTSAAKGTRR